MYAIGTIIYGCPIGKKAGKWLNDPKKNQIDDWEELGLTVMYSGSADCIPCYCGIALGEIDEATDAILIDLDNKQIGIGGGCLRTIDDIRDRFSLEVSEDNKKKVEDMISKLPNDLQLLLPPIGIYLVWSTS